MQQNLTHLTQKLRGPTLCWSKCAVKEKKNREEYNKIKKINLINLINVMNQKNENLIIHPTVNLQFYIIVKNRKRNTQKLTGNYTVNTTKPC